MLNPAMLGTLAKAQEVLDLYSVTRPEWGVSEVAAQCGWPPSSTHLLMSSLAQTGLLHRTVSGRYRLGFKLHRLSQILLHNTPWRGVVAARLSDISRQTGETTFAAALDGAHLIAVFSQSGHVPLTDVTLLGETPLHASAAGKVMLAARLRDDRHLWPPLGEAVRRELQEVQLQGYATDLQGSGKDLCAVAAPVFNHSDEVIAAISLLARPARFEAKQQAYTRLIRDAATEISEALGHLPELSGETEQLVWVSRGGVEQLQRRARPAARRPAKREETDTK